MRLPQKRREITLFFIGIRPRLVGRQAGGSPCSPANVPSPRPPACLPPSPIRCARPSHSAYPRRLARLRVPHGIRRGTPRTFFLPPCSPERVPRERVRRPACGSREFPLPDVSDRRVCVARDSVALVSSKAIESKLFGAGRPTAKLWLRPASPRASGIHISGRFGCCLRGAACTSRQVPVAAQILRATPAAMLDAYTSR